MVTIVFNIILVCAGSMPISMIICSFLFRKYTLLDVIIESFIFTVWLYIVIYFSRQFLIPMSSFIDSVYSLILGGSKSHVLFAYVRLIAYSIGLIPMVVIGLIWKWTLRNSALKKYSRFKTYIRNVISYTLWHISSKK